MLVFAAITPHPPLLIPNIGKEQLEKLQKTKTAMEKLEKEIYISKPDLIFIISPHCSFLSDAFTINARPKIESDFEQFGDFNTKKIWEGASEIAQKLQMLALDNGIGVYLSGRKKIDHGSSVPLFSLTAHLPNVKVITIGFCSATPKVHLNFGQLLKQYLDQTNLRVAVIASGDLSHALNSDAPAGFNKSGAKFDQKILQLLETKNTIGIAGLDPELLQNAAECGYRSLLILLGILQKNNYNFKNYSYEAPFGVGYLVGNFVFP